MSKNLEIIKRTLDVLKTADGKISVDLLYTKDKGKCFFDMRYNLVDIDDPEKYEETVGFDGTGFRSLEFSEEDMQNNDNVLNIVRTLSIFMPEAETVKDVKTGFLMNYMDSGYFIVADFMNMVYQQRKSNPEYANGMLKHISLDLSSVTSDVVTPAVITLIEDSQMAYIITGQTKNPMVFATNKAYSICMAGVMELLVGNGTPVELDD